MQLLGAWHFSQMKKKWQAHENSCCVELQRPILPPMALPNHDPTSPNLLQGPVFIACLIYHSFQACKIPCLWIQIGNCLWSLSHTWSETALQHVEEASTTYWWLKHESFTMSITKGAFTQAKAHCHLYPWQV
jgi:hypothetical protein